jgi:hypothetical protein
MRLYVALPRTLEEEPNDKNLEGAHGNDESNLDEAEVNDPLLRAADRAEVSVLSGAEVLLVPGDGGKLA